MTKKIFIIIFSFIFSFATTAQDNYSIIHHKEKVEIPFRLINNLIIIRVKINQVDFNLVFDTGAKQTILINLKPKDSLLLNKTQKKYFRGVGKDYNKVLGLVSDENNIIIANKIQNKKAKVYLISGYDFKFSEIIGVEINGFIGGDLIKNFIVKIDNKHKKLVFYHHKSFDKKQLIKYRAYSLEIIRDKPYLKTVMQFAKKAPLHPVKMLLDTGNGDAVWFFENDSLKLPTDKKTITEYFGFGLGGEISGKRTVIKQFGFDKKYKFKNLYLGIPNHSFVKNILQTKPFDGLVGNEILKRFYIIFDYKNHKMYLKKYRKNYRKSFVFNNSGLFLAYDGKIYVKFRDEVVEKKINNSQSSDFTISFEKDFIYRFKLVDKIVIYNIRKNSPADKAGLIQGDVLLEINGKNVYQYKLYELDKEFFYHNIKKLDLLINRNGIEQHIIIDNKNQL